MATSVLELDRDDFFQQLDTQTTPRDILFNACRIYSYLGFIFLENCMDSTLREWAFQWASEKSGINYGVFYNVWLELN